MGFFSSVGKVFKKVVSSKVFKIAAIAAAVYFTAGIGLAAMGSEFAAGLPFISDAAGALGITSGALGAAGGGAGGLVAAGGGAAFDAAAAGGISSGMEAGVGAASAATGNAGIAAAAGVPASSSIGTQALSTAGKTFGQNALQSITGSGQPGSNQGGGTKNWFDQMSQGSQGVMLMSGITGIAKAGLNAYGMKTQQDAEQARYDQSRQDAIRRSGVQDFSAAFHPAYHTPTEIVNSYTPGG